MRPGKQPGRLGAEIGDQGKVRVGVAGPYRALQATLGAFCLCSDNSRKHREGSGLHADCGVGEKLHKVSVDAGSADRRPLPWSFGSVGRETCTWVSGYCEVLCPSTWERSRPQVIQGHRGHREAQPSGAGPGFSHEARSWSQGWGGGRIPQCTCLGFSLLLCSPCKGLHPLSCSWLPEGALM